ncbi:MAG: HD domain-containing protein [Clostridia bacterium]|nr:HD domain-containing protein [Clostridia bacterium]
MNNVILTYDKIFWEFVHKYDINDNAIFRKITHSFDVANACYKIACHYKLSENERNFSYLVGLFHDLGRFEQWKRYKSYSDIETEDHADISCEFIKDMPAESLNITERQKEVLMLAIAHHTKVYNGADREVIFYNQMLNNSDSFSNIFMLTKGTHRINQTADGHTPQIIKDFENLAPLWHAKSLTKLDRCITFLANFYYVKLDFLRKEILENNYMDEYFNSYSQLLNQEDKKMFKNILDNFKSRYLQAYKENDIKNLLDI